MWIDRLLAWAALAALLILPGCASAPAGERVVVIGLDGADPHVIDLLMSEGKLPNFARLRQEGAYGRLVSMKPLLSPVIWTTIATGKTPDQHRIGHFVAVNQVTGEQLPVTSRMRKAKALWKIASDRDRSVAVIGWWATWPAETVNGSIVSDHLCYHFLFEDGFDAGSAEAVAKTHPPELAEEVARFVKRPVDLTLEEAAPFIDVGAEEFSRPFDFQDEVGHFKWALSTAASYREIARHLWEKDSPDLMMVYFEGLDSTSHLFGHLFRVEGLAGELAEQQKRYGNAVEQWYLYADRLVGEFMEMMDERTTLAILSDHGFQLGALPDDPSRTRDMRRVSERYHTIEGILYLYGRGVKPHSLLNGPSILDVTPTLLALMGIPPGRDMPGRILAEGLTGEPIADRVATHESGEAVDTEVAADSAVDAEILEKLGSLGYLDAASPAGERNLAAVLFESGRYGEAVEAYAKLVEEEPEDGGLRASLAGALGAMGRFDEALEQLTAAIDLQPLNPEAHHNRAVIHERNGDTEAAVKDYRTALRYSPEYEPARRALRRLQASDRVGEPATPAQQLAYKMAEQASQLARRGDYEEAMRRLDEAQRIAPRYSLVYQYRSNVAYLMGDREGAREALRKGLEIEPDNALFKENLRRLEQQSPTP
jgi:predicted AlkP superfamily phosphohydrolase/phosphomutase/Flp pilus assembly protein TadD